jgi:hypothetical protein
VIHDPLGEQREQALGGIQPIELHEPNKGDESRHIIDVLDVLEFVMVSHIREEADGLD